MEDKGEQQQKCHVHIVQVLIILELITLLIGIQFLLLVHVEEWNVPHSLFHLCLSSKIAIL